MKEPCGVLYWSAGKTPIVNPKTTIDVNKHEANITPMSLNLSSSFCMPSLNT